MATEILVYDQDCGFCTWLADYFGQRTNLELVGFDELTDEHRSRLPEEYEDCSHLVTDDAVYSCGAAIEQGLARADVPPGSAELIAFLRGFEDYEEFRDRLYWEFADRRGLLGQFLSKSSVNQSGQSGTND